MKTANFATKNGIGVLLCSECSRVIKTQKDFSVIEQYAYEGIIKLMPQYCSIHEHLEPIKADRYRVREKLREAIMKKNLLGLNITRPTQELYVMRGISGAGKSTQAKKLVGEGIIHSTDDLVEATGDYAGYFKRMNETKDWSEHGRMHHKNFLNAKKSMQEGISPVIIDNTCLRLREVENYIIEGLKLGFDENNIKIVDVGSGGKTSAVLAERNSHNVPLETIKKMIQVHKSVGKITVGRVVENYLLKEQSRVLYSAVVLDDESRKELIDTFASDIPEGWEVIAHHMTIVFGKGLEDKSELGKEVELLVTKLGISDMAMAVKVVGYPSANKIPHVTIAVNRAEGGKPFLSNKITNWDDVDLGHQLKLYGTVKEIKP